MSTLGILALGAGEVAFFTRPPRRDPGAGHREGRLRRIGRAIRLIGRELDQATRQTPVQAIPRLRNYPY